MRVSWHAAVASGGGFRSDSDDARSSGDGRGWWPTLFERQPRSARPGDGDATLCSVNPQRSARRATYTVAGSGKLLASRDRLLAGARHGLGRPRADDAGVRLIRMIETTGAIGLIVPWAMGILTPLTPLAAWGWQPCRSARSGRTSTRR